MSSPLISGGRLVSLLCLARVRHCLLLLMRVVMNWCVSLLVRLICCWIILTASSRGRLLICRPLAIRLLVLPPLPSGRERSGVSCLTWTLMMALTHWVCFLFFLWELVRPGRISAEACSAGRFPACCRQTNVTPILKGTPSSPVANYRQIFITSVLTKVFERLVSVRVGWFGMQWCASNHPGYLSERSGEVWCTFVRVLYTAKCLESGQEATIVQIDFRSAFDKVNHQNILYRLCFFSIAGLCCLY